MVLSVNWKTLWKTLINVKSYLFIKILLYVNEQAKLRFMVTRNNLLTGFHKIVDQIKLAIILSFHLNNNSLKCVFIVLSMLENGFSLSKTSCNIT